jgi:ABC-type phosphate transport system auxiliary subunit
MKQYPSWPEVQLIQKQQPIIENLEKRIDDLETDIRLIKSQIESYRRETGRPLNRKEDAVVPLRTNDLSEMKMNELKGELPALEEELTKLKEQLKDAKAKLKAGIS